MAHRVTLIPGDGIGPEVAEAIIRILDAAGAAVTWELQEAGQAVANRTGNPLPDAVLESIRRNRVALKGRISTPVGRGYGSPNVRLRKALDLYANLRPVRNFPGFRTRYSDVDLVVVRENTEGEYAGLEHEVVPGVVESLKVVTAAACTRIARFAFQYARRHGRKKVTALHKANIMKLADGLFLECARALAGEYPEIQYQEMIIDNACMQLVLNPYQFDVLVMENFYGDLVSDVGSGLVGGLGAVPGVNLGDEVAVFEAIHGDAAHLAGKGLANPLPLLVSAILMLRHLGEAAIADRVTAAAGRVLAEGRAVTPDLGGRAETREMTEAIIAAL